MLGLKSTNTDRSPGAGTALRTLVLIACSALSACASLLGIDDDDPCNFLDYNGQLLLHYRFDDLVDSVVTDELERHDGMVAAGALDLEQQPDGCGAAIDYPPDRNTYVRVEHDRELKPETGSLRVRLRTPGEFSVQEVIVSSDHGGVGLGELTLYINTARRAVLRMQKGTDFEDVLLCSNELDPDTWYTMTIDFGTTTTRFFVDEREVTYSGSTHLYSEIQMLECGVAATVGLEANVEPWFIGASNDRHESEGSPVPVGNYFSGAIDELLLSNQRTF